MVGSDENSGFDDAGGVFTPAPTMETHQAIYHQVLAAYGFRCALVGEQFEQVQFGKPHPALRLVAIWPREEGGPLHVGNYLPLSAEAADAFRLGHFIVADDYQIIVDRRVMRHGLSQKLADGQFLHLPKDPLYWPDRALLAHHRAIFLRP